MNSYITRESCHKRNAWKESYHVLDAAL